MPDTVNACDLRLFHIGEMVRFTVSSEEPDDFEVEGMLSTIQYDDTGVKLGVVIDATQGETFTWNVDPGAVVRVTS
jgi:hypothetical protein